MVLKRYGYAGYQPVAIGALSDRLSGFSGMVVSRLVGFSRGVQSFVGLLCVPNKVIWLLKYLLSMR